MNKNDIGAAVAVSTGLTNAQGVSAVDAVFEAITSALKAGEDVRVPGFGVFTVTDRAERQGRNPQTGEAMTIAASRHPKLKVAKGLKDALNG